MAIKSQLYLFVDNSNVLIEGRRFAQMVRTGAKKLSSYKDDRYEIDWGKFLYTVKEGESRVLAKEPILYGSRPPAEDSVWQRIRDEGLSTKLFDRNVRNKEKGVDMEMGMDVAELFGKDRGSGIIVIAAGDADYVPVVERAKTKGWPVEVWFWDNIADALRRATPRFCSLNKHFKFLRRGGGAVC